MIAGVARQPGHRLGPRTIMRSSMYTSATVAAGCSGDNWWGFQPHPSDPRSNSRQANKSRTFRSKGLRSASHSNSARVLPCREFGKGWREHTLSNRAWSFGRPAPLMSAIQREKVGPGQESVWDYPRPPRLEPVKEIIKIIFNGETIVETTSAYRVLETSHPPVYYIPPVDIKMEFITRAPGSSFCEWKGTATWWTLSVGSKTAEKVAWSYESPSNTFLPIKGFLAFYAGPLDACFVGEEKAQPQPGKFYGGWVTSTVVGPFKGGLGSWGW